MKKKVSVLFFVSFAVGILFPMITSKNGGKSDKAPIEELHTEALSKKTPRKMQRTVLSKIVDASRKGVTEETRRVSSFSSPTNSESSLEETPEGKRRSSLLPILSPIGSPLGRPAAVSSPFGGLGFDLAGRWSQPEISVDGSVATVTYQEDCYLKKDFVTGQVSYVADGQNVIQNVFEGKLALEGWPIWKTNSPEFLRQVFDSISSIESSYQGSVGIFRSCIQERIFKIEVSKTGPQTDECEVSYYLDGNSLGIDNFCQELKKYRPTNFIEVEAMIFYVRRGWHSFGESPSFAR